MTLGLLAVAMAVLIADQASKVAVTRWLPEGVSRPVLRGLRWRRVVNRRPFWVRSSGGLCIVWGMTMLLALGLASCVPTLDDRMAQASLGAALGGATGNALDRLLRHGITDFVEVGFWPVFNVADAAIVGGAVGVAWRIL